MDNVKMLNKMVQVFPFGLKHLIATHGKRIAVYTAVTPKKLADPFRETYQTILPGAVVADLGTAEAIAIGYREIFITYPDGSRRYVNASFYE